jgi:hypothetical protein
MVVCQLEVTERRCIQPSQTFYRADVTFIKVSHLQIEEIDMNNINQESIMTLPFACVDIAEYELPCFAIFH